MTPVNTTITGGRYAPAPLTPHATLEEVYAAFNARDLELMTLNWASAADISMSNPLGGIKHGWDEIKTIYQRLFAGTARVHVEFHDYSIHECGDVFYAVGRERGEFRVADTIVALAIRTSRVYRRSDGRWRQVHHHGSIEDPALLQRYQTAVRQAHS